MGNICQQFKIILTTCFQSGFTNSGFGHLFLPFPVWSVFLNASFLSSSWRIGIVMLKFSLKSFAKFGSFPRGLKPAPVPGIGFPKEKSAKFLLHNLPLFY